MPELKKPLRMRKVRTTDLELKDRLVSIQRVTKVTKGGRTFTFSAIVVVGNENGVVGYGLGKASEVTAAIDGNKPIKVYDFNSNTESEIEYSGLDGILGGHGGGDDGIIETLYDYLTGNYFGKSVPTIEESCYNHLITFAAEESRRTQKVVDFEEYVKSF